MKPLLWLILGAALAISGQAFAQYVNEYGNSLDYTRGIGPQRGQPNAQNPNGTISPPPVIHRSPC